MTALHSSCVDPNRRLGTLRQTVKVMTRDIANAGDQSHNRSYVVKVRHLNTSWSIQSVSCDLFEQSVTWLASLSDIQPIRVELGIDRADRQSATYRTHYDPNIWLFLGHLRVPGQYLAVFPGS